jgi:hypothetical protein
VSSPQVPAPPPAEPSPRFPVGAAVRVKAGTADPDYDDIPLGGWAGVVRAVEADEGPPGYLVGWTPETLAAAHPAYRRRCERDGLDFEEAWMAEADLEPDAGGPLAIEQPKKLRPAPLNQDDPEDRARSVFGLSSDDELPALDPTTLGRFHEHLSRRLHFPFPAADPDLDPVLVLRLLPPERADPALGLLIEVSRDDGRTEEMLLCNLEPVPGTPGRRDLLAHAAWVEARGGEEEELTPESAADPLLYLGLVLVLAAALVGAAWRALPDAMLAIQVGAGVLAVVGGFVGAGFERLFRGSSRLPPGVVGGLLLGMLIGAVLGAALGTLVLAFLGAIPGAILGTLLGRFARAGPVKSTFAGAYLGGLVYLFTQDGWAALGGGALGALAGAVLFVLILVALGVYLKGVFRGNTPAKQ